MEADDTDESFAGVVDRLFENLIGDRAVVEPVWYDAKARSHVFLVAEAKPPAGFTPCASVDACHQSKHAHSAASAWCYVKMQAADWKQALSSIDATRTGKPAAALREAAPPAAPGGGGGGSSEEQKVAVAKTKGGSLGATFTNRDSSTRVASLDPASPLLAAGIPLDARITRVNGTLVHTKKQLLSAVAGARDDIFTMSFIPHQPRVRTPASRPNAGKKSSKSILDTPIPEVLAKPIYARTQDPRVFDLILAAKEKAVVEGREQGRVTPTKRLTAPTGGKLGTVALAKGGGRGAAVGVPAPAGKRAKPALGGAAAKRRQPGRVIGGEIVAAAAAAAAAPPAADESPAGSESRKRGREPSAESTDDGGPANKRAKVAEALKMSALKALLQALESLGADKQTSHAIVRAESVLSLTATQARALVLVYAQSASSTWRKSVQELFHHLFADGPSLAFCSVLELVVGKVAASEVQKGIVTPAHRQSTARSVVGVLFEAESEMKVPKVMLQQLVVQYTREPRALVPLKHFLAPIFASGKLEEAAQKLGKVSSSRPRK
ncbi:hypothetical protein DIPPA_05310 [Diplonema papillatum]|nr:hypothetical protein DIPPA_05310 [Diplonema papillatum]